jgi:hypothetical protein
MKKIIIPINSASNERNGKKIINNNIKNTSNSIKFDINELKINKNLLNEKEFITSINELYENVKVLHNYTNISKTENNNNSEKIKNEKSNINNNDYINLELNFNKFYNNAISFFKNMKNNNENNEKGISISNKEENKKNLSDKIIPKTAKKNSFDILDDNKINIIDKNNKKKKIYTKTPCKGLKNIEKQKPTKTSKNNKLN